MSQWLLSCVAGGDVKWKLSMRLLFTPKNLPKTNERTWTRKGFVCEYAQQQNHNTPKVETTQMFMNW